MSYVPQKYDYSPVLAEPALILVMWNGRSAGLPLAHHGAGAWCPLVLQRALVSPIASTSLGAAESCLERRSYAALALMRPMEVPQLSSFART